MAADISRRYQRVAAPEEKIRMAEEAYKPGSIVSVVARQPMFVPISFSRGAI